MNIKNWKQFALFDYNQGKSKFFKLGDVVINKDKEIGVIIQIHNNYEFRVDKYGNTSAYPGSFCESKLASIEQIKKYKPELLKTY